MRSASLRSWCPTFTTLVLSAELQRWLLGCAPSALAQTMTMHDASRYLQVSWCLSFPQRFLQQVSGLTARRSFS